MCKIINDFIKSANTKEGYGFFEGVENNFYTKGVVDYAMNIGKSQSRQYKRYGIVPSAFISYLKSLKVLPEKLEIPRNKRTIADLADFLFQIQHKDRIVRGLGLYIREQLLKDIYPNMKHMFGSSEKIWKVGEKKMKYLIKRR